MDLNFPTGSSVPEWPSDAWVDPDAERTLLKQRLTRHRFGFSMIGLALVVASLSTIGQMILFFRGIRMPLGAILGIPQWELIEGGAIVWISLFGVVLLCGRWPDESWSRRSGLLLLMCLVDAVLWLLDHSTDLGLSDLKVEHEWLRDAMGRALGWSEFALIASLAGDSAAHHGQPQAADFAKAVRSLATTGAMVWFMYFYFRTNWNPPLWPLRERPLDPNSFMLFLGWMVLVAVLLVQTTGLTLLAGRSCGRALREIAAEERASDILPSRSEAGWEEFNPPSKSSGSGPNRGG